MTQQLPMDDSQNNALETVLTQLLKVPGIRFNRTAFYVINLKQVSRIISQEFGYWMLVRWPSVQLKKSFSKKHVN